MPALELESNAWPGTLTIDLAPGGKGEASSGAGGAVARALQIKAKVTGLGPFGASVAPWGEPRSKWVFWTLLGVTVVTVAAAVLRNRRA